jgi:16S rRNA (guanine966-N2)-methyltransferase
MAVRVTGGELRGRVLEVPGGARPTEGRVREALFSMWRERLASARLLDLFAGSGIVGCEAVGRGAERALCADSDPRAVRIIERNAARLGLPRGAVTAWRLSLPGGLARLAAGADRFDLAFADPPYRFEAYAALIAGVAPVLAEGGELAVEHSARVDLPEQAGPLARVDVRRYGEIALSFYQAAPAP